MPTKSQKTADNDPILTLTLEQRAYLAGLIDGEGCFMIGRVGPKRATYYPKCSIAMTHRAVIEWAAQTLGTGSIKVNNGPRSRRGWKTQWKVDLFGKRVQRLCTVLLPFLIVKQEHARLILGFPADARQGPGTRLSPELRAVRHVFQQRMGELNRRGTPDA